MSAKPLKSTRPRKSTSREVAASVEFWPLTALPAYERNARTHSPEQIAQIAASILGFGFAGSILADGAGIVAGHGRVEALRKLYAEGAGPAMVGGLAIPMDHAPVIDCSGWSKAQRRAFIIADNRIAEHAGWDEALLALEFAELADMGFDLSLIGYSEADRRSIVARAANGLTDADDAPEPPAKPVACPGDLYVLGEHRVLCGDCTDEVAVARLLDGATPHLMVTDPPYGVAYDAAWRNRVRRADGSKVGARAVGKVDNDDRSDWREAWDLFPGDVGYVWHAGLNSADFARSLWEAGFDVRTQIIWTKSQFAIGRGDYHWQHEPCWYCVRTGKPARWSGDRKQTTVWNIDKPVKSETGHSTQKPIECMRRPILNNSRAGETVYDPFLGSGTTLIACEMEGRICFGLELNPVYVDVIVRRWEEFTGRNAERIRPKRTDAKTGA